MMKLLKKRIEIALQEGKDELDICDLKWNDSFFDVFNYSPDFDFGQEEHTSFFYGCMCRIYELEFIIKEILNKK